MPCLPCLSLPLRFEIAECAISICHDRRHIVLCRAVWSLVRPPCFVSFEGISSHLSSRLSLYLLMPCLTALFKNRDLLVCCNTMWCWGVVYCCSELNTAYRGVAYWCWAHCSEMQSCQIILHGVVLCSVLCCGVVWVWWGVAWYDVVTALCYLISISCGACVVFLVRQPGLRRGEHRAAQRPGSVRDKHLRRTHRDGNGIWERPREPRPSWDCR